MADEGKKVSFGFSKSIKKSALKILPKVEEKKIDYIECLDDKVIKVVGEEEKKDGPLVIPLLGSKTWHDRILNKTDADIFEPKIKNESSMKITNGNVKSEEVPPIDVSRIKKEEPVETVPKSLEEQAASEIMEDLRGNNIKVENLDFTVPLANDEALQGKQESTLEDYEQIPIDAFGLAMLRGMGWKPGKGIGRNEQLVVATLPELRPRGMGLGADKAMIQKQIAQAEAKGDEELKLEKGSFVQIIAGKYTNNYGQIEAFDDDGGRIRIKMALTGESLSLNECLVKPVTKAEYMKNSKVLNASKYEEYKNENSTNEHEETNVVTLDSEASENGNTKNRHEERKISKKSKKRSKYTSDESSDSDHRPRKRRNSSDTDQRDNRQKRTKKSKKSHKRDSSAERSSKKSKKKDKKRTRERKSDHTESSDRGKHKKHKRSRSRSPARR